MQIAISKRLVLVVLIVVVVLAAWWLIDWLVVTDSDRVEMTLDRLSDAVERGDKDAVKAEVDESFVLGKVDWAGLEPWIDGALRDSGPLKVDTLSTDVQIESDLAKVHAETWVESEIHGGPYRIDWDLELVRRGETWKLTRLRGFIQPGNRELPLSGLNRFVSP